MKRTEFFRRVTGYSLGFLIDQRQAGFTIEDLYQAFKQRLIDELEVEIPWSALDGECGNLGDRSVPVELSEHQKQTSDGSAEEIGGP